MAERRIAVVGAGLAGLAAAYELARTGGVAFTLFEATDRLGGTVETLTFPTAAGEPFVVETGPDSWVSEKRAARELAVALGLGDELIYSNDPERRNYLARPGHGVRGELVPMPEGMRMMVPTRWAPVLESPLFSWQARLAYLREPKRADELREHARARQAANSGADGLGEPDETNESDESVASFVRRHFGEEATETIAGPLLAGVFGGDIETLSAGAVLAQFVRMEREHGSLITAVMQRAANAGPTPEPIFTTLRSGLGMLIGRMAGTLPDGSVRTGMRVTSVRREGGEWLVRAGSAGPAEMEGCEHRFDGVVLATPAHVTRELLLPVDAAAAALLAMEATSAIVVALLWEPPAAGRLRVPRGFGFLVPPAVSRAAVPDQLDQGDAWRPSLLAGTFMDQKFPGRAPAGARFLRGFFGGQAAEQMMGWEDARITAAARAEFGRYLLAPLPEAAHAVVRRWPRSLPQYAVGHLARMRRLAGRVAALPGLALTGNAYGGVGLPNLVEHGRAAARALAASVTACDANRGRCGG